MLYRPCLVLVQGLGEEPRRILAGTSHWGIYVLERHPNHLYVSEAWLDGYHYGQMLTCMAATDEVVVTGYQDGALRACRMDTPL
jgi:hypothetical protein